MVNECRTETIGLVEFLQTKEGKDAYATAHYIYKDFPLTPKELMCDPQTIRGGLILAYLRGVHETRAFLDSQIKLCSDILKREYDEYEKEWARKNVDVLMTLDVTLDG